MSLAKITPFVARNSRLIGDSVRSAPNVSAALALIAAGLIYSLILLPNAPASHPILRMNPEIYNSITKALSSGWYRLLLPFEYEVGRFYWCPGIIFFVYWGERLLEASLISLYFILYFLVQFMPIA